jgi:hypothetical protein
MLDSKQKTSDETADAWRAGSGNLGPDDIISHGLGIGKRWRPTVFWPSAPVLFTAFSLVTASAVQNGHELIER